MILLRFYYTLVLSPFLFLSVAAQQKIKLNSPDGAIHFSFQLIKGAAFYEVFYKDKPLIRMSSLSLYFNENKFEKELKSGAVVYRQDVEKYELVAGKNKKIEEHYSEVGIPMVQTKKPYCKINLRVRAFNSGIAFRYEVQKKDTGQTMILEDELTSFHLEGDPILHTLFLPNFTSSHEGLYTTVSLSKLEDGQLMDMPTLIEFPAHIFMAITEAALLDYAGMYLSKKNGALLSTLSPIPKNKNIKVIAALPHNSPWRVLLISDKIGNLIESNIITSLNERCKLEDVSWIKPGKTSFPWWNGNVVPDTLNAPGNNFVTQQYYIDFCARNNIDYHSVVEYGLHQWYMDDGIGFQPGPHADVTTPVPGLDMKQVCDYAKQKGVGIRVWVHWAALYPKLDTAFSVFEKWGLSGMMVDFMDRDDQEMVNMQTEILQKAAAHHLHIQFHGAYKPTGVNRTYPNELTREGTLNYENNKWNEKGISPDHDLDIVFTRMLAGSTDYHMGGFRAVPANKFKAQYTRPLMLGTRGHMLGMYVVLESYLGMVCDYPAAYEGEPGFDFVKQVPTTWDETKVLGASVSQFVIIARKKGTDWFVGSINNEEARTETISFAFLDTGKYKAEIYSDAADAQQQPNHIMLQEKIVTKEDKLKLQLAPGGGFGIRLKKVL